MASPFPRPPEVATGREPTCWSAADMSENPTGRKTGARVSIPARAFKKRPDCPEFRVLVKVEFQVCEAGLDKSTSISEHCRSRGLHPITPFAPSRGRAMPAEDFDIERLAVYLHLDPQQVKRLANRGKLPGRRVAGQWRFSQAEIHHWLEQRIGLSDDDELVDVEGVLAASSTADVQEEIVIAELLSREAIAVPLKARTRNSVFNAMIELAAETGWLWDPEKMAEAVRSREDMYPTTLAGGVALLHPRRPMPNILGQAFLALGCTPTGIPFGGPGGLTDVFFLICSVDDRGHLRTLARLSRVISSPGFLDEIRQAPDRQAAHQLIAHTEARLS